MRPTCARCFSRVGAAGGLDVLCANAGIAGPTSAIEDIDLDAWRACVAVNLDGAFLAAKHAAPMMKSAALGQHHFDLFDRRSVRLSVPSAICLGKMGGYRVDENAGDGTWVRMGIRANAICPGAVEGPRMEGVLGP